MYLPVPPRPDDPSAVPPLPRAVPPLRANPPAAKADPLTNGSFHLCRVVGVDVFVHWTWFAAAYFLLKDRPAEYSSFTWSVFEYLGGFGLVLLHEFGHVLGCRQTGGVANRIVLWPLGGLAFVSPPPRPGAALWTTIAGPLVNVVFVPVLYALLALTSPAENAEIPDDLHFLIWRMWEFNLVMLVFNLLPVFPLDGGRILHAVLWFWLGPVRSLMIAAGLGVICGIGLLILALTTESWWFVAVSIFLLLGSINGVSTARALSNARPIPRHEALACPGCGAAPPVGPYWQCSRCQAPFDLLGPPQACPAGGSHACTVSCLSCGRHLERHDWQPTASAGPAPGRDAAAD